MTHWVDLALLKVLRAQLRPAHDLAEQRAELRKRRLCARGDVEIHVGGVTRERQDVDAGDVADIDEVHRLEAVAKDQRRLATVNAVHPADHHLGIHAVDVHARAVDVEVAQRGVGQPVHFVEAAQHMFEANLVRAVERAVVEGVILVHRQVAGLTVDRGARGGDHFLDTRRHGRFEDVERAVHHDSVRLAWRLRALRDTQRRLVIDVVHALHAVGDELAVADVAFHEGDPSACAGAGKVLAIAAYEVIDGDHLGHTCVDQRVGDVRADESCAPCDQNSAARQLMCHSCFPAPPTWAGTMPAHSLSPRHIWPHVTATCLESRHSKQNANNA